MRVTATRQLYRATTSVARRPAPRQLLPLSLSQQVRFSSDDKKSGAGAQLSDPYPLPFSPDVVDLNNAKGNPESKWNGVNLASERQNIDGVDAPMRVPGREGEDRTTKIARLVYQCRKRGTLETDLLLSTFAKKELHTLPEEELDEFDRVSIIQPALLFSGPSLTQLVVA